VRHQRSCADLIKSGKKIKDTMIECRLSATSTTSAWLSDQATTTGYLKIASQKMS